MGLTNKLISKSRTKAISGPVGITGDWDTRAQLAAAAVVRAVAANLGVKDLQSSSFRGKEMFGINRSMNSSDSTIWVRQLNIRTWEITLGRAIINYDRSIDWQICAAVADEPPGRIIAIVTGAYATLDGAMVNRAEFTESRDFLLAGFAQGYAKSQDNELALDRASFPQSTTKVVTAKPELANGRRTIRTRLTLAQIEDCLRFLPNRTLDHGDVWRTVQLGFGTHADAARLELSDEDTQRAITVTWDVAMTDDRLFHERKLHDAALLPDRIVSLLAPLDAAVAVSGE